MRTASLGLRDAIREGKQPHIQAFVTWGDGTNEWLYDDDFMTDSVSLQNGTSSSGSFDVGGAVISSFSFSLNNWDGKFDEKDFVGAKITCYTGLPVALLDFALITEDGEEFVTEDEQEVLVTENASEEYGTIEWIEYGTYYFVDHRTIGKTIVCETYDALKLLDENMLSDNNISYPISAHQMVRIIATHNGIILKNYNFMNGDVMIEEAPESDITERQALSYIAQMCGLYAVMNSQGLLDLNWYSEPNYSVRSRFDHNLNVEDINITGVHIYYGTEDDENYLRGREGYVIGIRDNPFINENNYATVAKNIGDNVIGLTFRSGSMSVLSDIRLEAGDIIHTYDDKGVFCNFIVTNLEYRLSLRETLTCDAIPIEKTDLRRMESNVFAERVKKTLRSELTSYDAQYMQLSRLMSMSMGMFETKETNSDGSYVLYLHNKPNLAESSTVWKMTADAFAVSRNYNAGEGLRTWEAGITADGNAVVNVLSAIGINAGWVETGIITDKTGKNKWNLDTGVFELNSEAKVGETGYTLAQIKANADGISTKVSKGEIASTINQTAQSVKISASKIDLNGYVTINSLKSGGTTTIDGSRITTGSIAGKNNNVVFDITNGKLTLKNSMNLVINAGNFTLDASGNAKFKGTIESGSDITVGTISGGSGGRGFKATKEGNIYMGAINLLVKNSEYTTIWSDSDKGGVIRIPRGINAGDNNSKSRSFIHNGLTVYAASDGDHAFKAYGTGWFDGNVIANNVPSTSDRNKKKDIKTIRIDRALDFIMGLRPVSFKFKNNIESDDFTHHGFIAQEVEELADWDIVTDTKDGTKVMNHRDIIADAVSVLQMLVKQNESLENELKDCKKRLEKLEVRA